MGNCLNCDSEIAPELDFCDDDCEDAFHEERLLEDEEG